MNVAVDRPSTEHRTRFFRKVAAFVALTKPRVIELLLVTTAPVMILAQSTMPGVSSPIPNLWLVLGTLVGGTLSAGSANAFNCYIDRDIDSLTARSTKSASVP